MKRLVLLILLINFCELDVNAQKEKSASANACGDEACLLDIDLPYAGWHMISSNCVPLYNEIEEILDPIRNDVVQIKGLNGEVYIPAFGDFNNGFDHWNIQKGYLIKTNKPTSFQIEGRTVRYESQNIWLNKGWNLIAYWGQEEATPEYVFQSIVNDVVQVNNFEGAYIPAFDFSSIATMEPTKGYKVYMSEENHLSFFPSNTPDFRASSEEPGLSTDEKIPSNFKRKFGPNPISATMLIMAENCPLDYGDVLGVFDKEGVLAGSFVYNGENFGGLVFGNEQREFKKTGLNAFDKYIFKVWDKDLRKEKVVRMEIVQGSPRFEKDDLVVARFMEIGNLTPLALTEKVAVTAATNPETNTLFVSYEDNVKPSKIEIYNNAGQLVDFLPIIGNEKIVYPINHLERGNYVLKMYEKDSKEHSLNFVKH